MFESLVSRGIPTFNRPNYLKKAIVSALQHTYQNLEVICRTTKKQINYVGLAFGTDIILTT